MKSTANDSTEISFYNRIVKSHDEIGMATNNEIDRQKTIKA
jgi:hypothetical protein